MTSFVGARCALVFAALAWPQVAPAPAASDRVLKSAFASALLDGRPGEHKAELAVLDENGDVTIRSPSGLTSRHWHCGVPVNASTWMMALSRPKLQAEDDQRLCVVTSGEPVMQVLKASDGTVLWETDRAGKNSNFGQSACESLDAAGTQAIVVGSPGESSYFEGSVWACRVTDGATRRLELPSEAQRLGLGMSLCSTCEGPSAEGNREPRLVFVGAPACDDSRRRAQARTGAVVVLENCKYSRTLEGGGACFGWSVCVLHASTKDSAAGKVLAVSTSANSESATTDRVDLFSLSDLARIGSITSGEPSQLGFGERLLAVPDMNHDGLEELLIATTPVNQAGQLTGATQLAVFDGAAAIKLCDVPLPTDGNLSLVRDMKSIGDFLDRDERSECALALETFIPDEIGFRSVIVSLPKL